MNINLTGLDEIKSLLDEKVYAKALSKTLNELVALAKTEVSKQIRKRYNIKKRDLDRHIRIDKSNPNRPIAWINIKSKQGISLYRFSPSQLKPKKKRVVEHSRKINGKTYKVQSHKRTYAGVTKVKVLKNENRKVVKSGFISTVRGEHTAIFKRAKGSRSKLKKLYTVDVVGMFNEIGIKVVQRIIDENYDKIFWRNLDYLIKK